MDKEFLEDYYIKESELGNEFEKRVLDGQFSHKDIYPPRERFPKIKDPIAYAGPFESVWPLIPLYGSLIIPLFPRPKDNFAESHGFEASNIERMVDFCKDTGRIQFILGSIPPSYAGLDYLDPVFVELKPPNVRKIPYTSIASPDEIKGYRVEFRTLAQLGFYQYLRNFYEELGVPTSHINKRMHDYESDYVTLKLMGYNDLADKMGDAMVTDIDEANKLFLTFGNFLASPRFNPLRAIRNWDRYTIEIAIQTSKKFGKTEVKAERFRLPCEIGRFLMEKLTLFPESYAACIDVVGKYQQEDMLNIMHALDIGVKERDFDVVNKESEELSMVLDNIWNDARKMSHMRRIRYGLPIGLAIVGEMIAGPLGAVGGLLTGLGYTVAEELIKIEEDSITDKLAKLSSPNYVCAIYDFQKKYSIK